MAQAPALISQPGLDQIKLLSGIPRPLACGSREGLPGSSNASALSVCPPSIRKGRIQQNAFCILLGLYVLQRSFLRCSPARAIIERSRLFASGCNCPASVAKSFAWTMSVSSRAKVAPQISKLLPLRWPGNALQRVGSWHRDNPTSSSVPAAGIATLL